MQYFLFRIQKYALLSEIEYTTKIIAKCTSKAKLVLIYKFHTLLVLSRLV